MRNDGRFCDRRVPVIQQRHVLLLLLGRLQREVRQGSREIRRRERPGQPRGPLTGDRLATMPSASGQSEGGPHMGATGTETTAVLHTGGLQFMSEKAVLE